MATYDKGFRETQIIPSAEELLSSENAGDNNYIPINKVGEPYQDSYSYLETQFRLFREDLLAPYREALRKLRSISGLQKKKKNLFDIQIYTSVRYVGMRAGRDGVDYGVSFDVESGARVDWEKSKLLMNNSLLCISSNGFMTFFWAIVSNRDPRKLSERNIIGVRSPVDGHELIELQNGAEYCMFESTRAYHEAYVHALKVLQKPAMENLQFNEQLICLESSVQDVEYSVDWREVCKNHCDSVDESQEAAITQGLTKKLAVIQGPPGTGKTFTGLLIVKALLQINSAGPILIICCTNRALDQFLEGIYEFEKSLARMGSRTNSAILSECTVDVLIKKKKNKRELAIPKKLRGQLYRSSKEKKTRANAINYKCLNGFQSKAELSNLSRSYALACSQASQAKRDIQTYFLSKFKVLGMTTTFAARNHELLTSLKSEIMVVEEAAEVLEAQILGCLNPNVKHLILIGDHKQLRPSVATPKLVETHRLDVSLFERMVSSGIEYKTLQVQRRMRPAISTLLANLFYPMLKDHPSVHEFKDVSGVKSNVVFMDHDSSEDRVVSGSSRMNTMEADMVVQFCLYLTNCCGYKPSDISILSMYRSQTEEILRKINASYHLPSKQYNQKMAAKSYAGRKKRPIVNTDEFIPKVRSVDEFQGEESNIILLSLVRNMNSSDKLNSDAPQSSIGFLSIPNRICVALSRARIGLYIFGNAKLLSDKSSLWRDIIQHLEDTGSLGNGITLSCPRHPDVQVVAQRSQDLRKYSEGLHGSFCTKRCKERLTCGHSCPRKCHYGGHENFECRARCMKKIQWCGHHCKKICHANFYNSECFPCEQCRITTDVCNNTLKKLLTR